LDFNLHQMPRFQKPDTFVLQTTLPRKSEKEPEMRLNPEEDVKVSLAFSSSKLAVPNVILYDSKKKRSLQKLHVVFYHDDFDVLRVSHHSVCTSWVGILVRVTSCPLQCVSSLSRRSRRPSAPVPPFLHPLPSNPTLPRPPPDGRPIQRLDPNHPSLTAFDVVYQWEAVQEDDLRVGILAMFLLTLAALVGTVVYISCTYDRDAGPGKGAKARPQDSRGGMHTSAGHKSTARDRSY